MPDKTPLPAELDLPRLLADLTSSLGLSFAAREPRHFALLAARDREEFIDEVLVVEGLEPAFHKDLRAQVKKLVDQHCMAVVRKSLMRSIDTYGPTARKRGTLHLPRSK
jgi:hypothetical protein